MGGRRAAALTITVGAGVVIGTTEYRAVLAEERGQKFWQVGARLYANGNSASRVDADPVTFRPSASFWKHALLGEAAATYRPGEAEITRPGTEPVKVASEKTFYDNEQAMHLMRRLPLAVGYKTVLPVLATLGSAAPLPIGLEVTGIEAVEVPAGKFACFKVALSIGQTFYFSTDAHRYLVKYELLNLLDNAWKYSGDEKRITLSTAARNGSVLFRVQDNGVGLTPRESRAVFDRFHQADNRLSRSVGGCGLGLSIVRSIATAHRGDVRVESEPGRGSTFTLEIPTA